jgi:hypothetical protein
MEAETMNAELTAAIEESRHTNSTQTVLVDDIETTYLELLASDYEIDSEDAADLDGILSRRVWGWTGEGNTSDEAEWTLLLTIDSRLDYFA